MPRHQTSGLLVVIEGIDGGGKTTLQHGLAQSLRQCGYTVTETKEPTEGPLGKKIRAIAASDRTQISAEEEFQLFHEDRKIHVRNVVLPALARGEIVIQDRSYFSTVAYQGERGLDKESLLRRSLEIAPKPDVLLLIDLAPDVALDRIRSQRGQETDEFEKLESLTRIRAIFQSFKEAQTLDGRVNPDEIIAHARTIIDDVMVKRSSAS